MSELQNSKRPNFVDSFMYSTYTYMSEIYPVEEVEEIVLEPGQYLIQDIIFGTLIVGEIGRQIYTPEYIRKTYYGQYGLYGTKGVEDGLLDYIKQCKEEYVQKKFERIEVPFTYMRSTLAQVRWILHFKFNFRYNSIRPEVEFFKEFGIDSLEMISMLVEVEHYFGVIIELEDIETEKIITVQDVMDYLDLKRNKKAGKNLYPKGILYPAYPEFIPVYPSKNLFRPPLV